MAAPNLSEIVTTTIENRSRKLADNFTKNNALLYKLQQGGNVKPFSGGRTIVQELAYQENSTFKYYSGYETLDITPSEVISAAEYEIKQGAASVSISGLEQLQNSSKEALIDLLEARIQNAEGTLLNNASVGIYSDGTGTANKQITGLQAQVADTPSSGTVGGINRATWSFWRNYSFDATSTGGAATTSSNIQGYWNTIMFATSRGRDSVNLIVADNTYFGLYLASLQAIQRITDPALASLGFQSVKHMNADVVLDGGYGGGCPSQHAYFLNTKHIFWRPHRDRNFTVIGGERESVNQDAIVKLIGFAGNLTMDCAFTQGVFKE
jgi:hypothetical protein